MFASTVTITGKSVTTKKGGVFLLSKYFLGDLLAIVSVSFTVSVMCISIRTSSWRTHRKLALRLSLTWGRSARVSSCRRESTSSCRPPSKPTRTETFVCVSFPKNKLKHCNVSHLCEISLLYDNKMLFWILGSDFNWIILYLFLDHAMILWMLNYLM